MRGRLTSLPGSHISTKTPETSKPGAAEKALRVTSPISLRASSSVATVRMTLPDDFETQPNLSMPRQLAACSVQSASCVMR